MQTMSEGRNGETANWWLCSVDGLCDDVCLPFFRSNTLLRSCVCSFSLRIGDPFFFLQHTHRKFLSISPRSRDVHKLILFVCTMTREKKHNCDK